MQSAVAALQAIFNQSVFFDQKSDWNSHPNNVGHQFFPGCFRCHDGKHVSDDGKILSRDCNTCHVILAQQMERDTLRLSLGGVEYVHPVDIGDAWKETNCNECHNPQ